ncbi:MAG: hypothetical protein IGS48_05545 [Oscillatoriales cyanobacterium C42_A2020_001]|nr:hypothetical protein [Leptolyngbyaceae cyanobacterium C42_A2020_001]
MHDLSIHQDNVVRGISPTTFYSNPSSVLKLSIFLTRRSPLANSDRFE